MADKTEKLKFSMPKKYPVDKVLGLLNAVFSAFGEQDETLAGDRDSQFNFAKDMIFLETSEGFYLDRLGNNYGVVRPNVGIPDDTFRNLIRHIAFQPHNVLKIIRDVLTDLFGPSNGQNWDVYSIIPGEIIVALRDVSTPRTLLSATYLHTDATVDAASSYIGDYLRADSSEPGSPGSADTTDPDNPIYYIVILAADDLATPESLVLEVKAAGVAVKVESI